MIFKPRMDLEIAYFVGRIQQLKKQKKKHNNTPKRKRLSRKQRISMTKNWLKNYNGKNIVKGYSN